MPNLSTQVANELMSFDSQLLRVKGRSSRILNKAYRSLQSDILSQVTIETTVNKARLLELSRSVKIMITDKIEDIYGAVDLDLAKIVNATDTAMTAAINNSAGAALATHSLTSEQMAYIVKHTLIEGAKSADWWSGQSKDLAFKFNNVIQDGYVRGLTINQMSRGVKDLMGIAYRHANTLVHTSIINASNQARLDFISANDDISDGTQWLSTLDGDTTQICKALDGLTWDHDKKPVGHSQIWPGPTAHWGCRSTQTIWFKEFDDLPKDKQELMKGSRASLDGQVSATQDYGQWLKAKDKTNPDFVRSTLGARKYEIWKKHGLSMQDMVDQYNNPLTVDELLTNLGD